MNKGISQSGSFGSCEKHSDVFHHIRYANSPRAVVPHKSIEPPKKLFSLASYREAEKNLEKKLADQGYGASHRSIRRFAKAFRSLFFFLFFIPYFLAIKLPLTLLSVLCSTLFGFVRRLVKPMIGAVNRCCQKIASAVAKVQIPRWMTFSLRWNTKKSTEPKINKEKRIPFWKGWTLPKIPTWSFKISLPRFTWLEKVKNFKLSIPQWKISIPQLSLPNWKIPRISLPSRWFSLSFRWSVPVKWKFSLRKFDWKLPKIKNPFSSVAVWSIRESIARWTLQMNFDALGARIKERLARFKLPKRTKREKSRNVANVFQLYGERIENWCDEWVSIFPPVVQSILRPIGRGIGASCGILVNATSTFFSAVWNRVKKGIEKVSMVQDNLRSLHALHRKTREKVEKFVDKTADAATRPVIRTVETVHNKLIPIRLRVRRWTFLAGIVMELSLIFLQEAIFEFQMWNEERWISKINNNR